MDFESENLLDELEDFLDNIPSSTSSSSAISSTTNSGNLKGGGGAPCYNVGVSSASSFPGANGNNGFSAAGFRPQQQQQQQLQRSGSVPSTTMTAATKAALGEHLRNHLGAAEKRKMEDGSSSAPGLNGPSSSLDASSPFPKSQKLDQDNIPSTLFDSPGNESNGFDPIGGGGGGGGSSRDSAMNNDQQPKTGGLLAQALMEKKAPRSQATTLNARSPFAAGNFGGMGNGGGLVGVPNGVGGGGNGIKPEDKEIIFRINEIVNNSSFDSAKRSSELNKFIHDNPHARRVLVNLRKNKQQQQNQAGGILDAGVNNIGGMNNAGGGGRVMQQQTQMAMNNGGFADESMNVGPYNQWNGPEQQQQSGNKQQMARGTFMPQQAAPQQRFQQQNMQQQAGPYGNNMMPDPATGTGMWGPDHQQQQPFQQMMPQQQRIPMARAQMAQQGPPPSYPYGRAAARMRHPAAMQQQQNQAAMYHEYNMISGGYNCFPGAQQQGMPPRQQMNDMMMHQQHDPSSHFHGDFMPQQQQMGHPRMIRNGGPIRNPTGAMQQAAGGPMSPMMARMAAAAGHQQQPFMNPRTNGGEYSSLMQQQQPTDHQNGFGYGGMGPGPGPHADAQQRMSGGMMTNGVNNDVANNNTFNRIPQQQQPQQQAMMNNNSNFDEKPPFDDFSGAADWRTLLANQTLRQQLKGNLQKQVAGDELLAAEAERVEQEAFARSDSAEAYGMQIATWLAGVFQRSNGNGAQTNNNSCQQQGDSSASQGDSTSASQPTDLFGPPSASSPAPGGGAEGDGVGSPAGGPGSVSSSTTRLSLSEQNPILSKLLPAAPGSVGSPSVTATPPPPSVASAPPGNAPISASAVDETGGPNSVSSATAAISSSPSISNSASAPVAAASPSSDAPSSSSSSAPSATTTTTTTTSTSATSLKSSPSSSSSSSVTVANAGGGVSSSFQSPPSFPAPSSDESPAAASTNKSPQQLQKGARRASGKGAVATTGATTNPYSVDSGFGSPRSNTSTSASLCSPKIPQGTPPSLAAAGMGAASDSSPPEK